MSKVSESSLKVREIGVEPEIKSPCMSLCCLDEEDICIGCHRSVKEITGWGRMNNQERKAVMLKVVEREQASGRMMR